MKKLVVVLFVIMFVLGACVPENQTTLEQEQQALGISAITNNQPVPNLGGYSFERQIVVETYLARNNTITTYAYMFAMNGEIIEICPSIGYPIPYSTQLTNPSIPISNCTGQYGCPEGVVSNPEPNGLYPPGDAAATLVQCVQPDGTVSPVYIEWYVLAFPYRIQSDSQLQQVGETSFSVDVQP
jgi:hypothetical protein